MLRGLNLASCSPRLALSSGFRLPCYSFHRTHLPFPKASGFSTLNQGTYIYVPGKHRGIDSNRSSLINAYVQSMSVPEVHATMHALAMRLHADADLMPGRASTVQQMQAEFKLADRDSDSKISEEEFVAYLNMKDALSKVSAPPSSSALRRLFVSSLLPFVGFGMMDNGLMILFGDAIETHIGAVLTISTMACAAIGHWLSDLVGVMSGSTVEKLAQRCGLPHHGLSLEQLETPTAARAKSFGALLGISIGCFVGMLPLLFIDSKGRDELPQQHK